MGNDEPLAHLLQNIDYCLSGNKTLAKRAPELIQTTACDVLHSEKAKMLTVQFQNVSIESANDVGMIQFGEQHGFAEHLFEFG